MSFKELKPVFSNTEQQILITAKQLLEQSDVKSYFEFSSLATARNYNQEYFSLIVEEEIDKVVDKYIPIVDKYISEFHNKNKDISSMTDAVSIQENIKLYNEKLTEFGGLQMTRFSDDKIDSLIVEVKQHLVDANALYVKTLDDARWVHITTLLVKIVHPSKKTGIQTNSPDYQTKISDEINKTIEDDVNNLLSLEVWLELIRYPQLQPLLLPLVNNSSAYNLFFDQQIETDPENVKKQLEMLFTNESQEIVDRFVRLLKFLAYRPDNEDENKRIEEESKKYIDQNLGTVSLKKEEDVINYLAIRDVGYWKSISEMAYFDISMTDEITCLPSNYQIYYRDYEVVESIITLANVIFFKVGKAKNNDKRKYYTLPKEIQMYNDNLFRNYKVWDYTLTSVEKLAEQYNSLVKLVKEVEQVVKLTPVEPQVEPVVEQTPAEPQTEQPTPAEEQPQVEQPTPTETPAVEQQTSTSVDTPTTEPAAEPTTEKSATNVTETFSIEDSNLKFAIEEVEFSSLPLFSSINKLLRIESESFWITIGDFGTLEPNLHFLFELLEAILVERKIPNARLSVPDNNKYLFSSVVYLCDGSKYSDYEDTEESAIGNPFTYEVYSYFLSCTEYTLIFPIIQKQFPVVINTFLKSHDNQPIKILDFC